jgi:Tfp pilus assembly protein PilX
MPGMRTRSLLRLHVSDRRAPCASAAGSRQRGAASLIVVMVLFFLMALVAAYTNRNLIFEQRTSVNQYRSTQAFEVAEAGVEWAVAQLNGGRIDASCLEAGATPADTSFRERYLDINASAPPDPPTGMVTTRTQAVLGNPPRRAGCVWNGGGWTCSCPTDTNPALVAPVGSGVYPAFWVSFSSANVTRPGVVQIVAMGCTRLDTDCLSSTAATATVEGRALITAAVALKSAVTTPPVAALTVLGNASGGAVAGVNTAVTNRDAGRGAITVQAGGNVDPAFFKFTSTPGTPASASFVYNDPSLSSLLLALPNTAPANLVAAGLVPNDRGFASTFGLWPNSYRLQPAAVSLPCPNAGCADALVNTVTMNPDRVIWIVGNLTVEAAVNIGSAANPVTIVVAGDGANPGNVSLAAGATVYGLVYARNSGGGPGPGVAVTTWSGPGKVTGAALVESNFAGTAAPVIEFDGAVIDTLRLRSGSFVRVPGGWRDFQ